MTTVFKVGDQVRKVTGEYHISGEVRSIFAKADGAVRLVVEHRAEGGGSFLHIYSEANLALEIDPDGWIEWGGGDCPVAPNIVVDFITRDGCDTLRGYIASNLVWENSGISYDIIAYRIHRK